MLFLLVELVIVVAALAGLWKTFEKMGRRGWEGIVPIYNLYILVQIIGKPLWWIVLFMIPLVNIVPCVEVAGKFGKSAGFGVGLALLGFVFFPILGFGDAQFNAAGVAPSIPGMPAQ